jgi:hypothetical protein
MAVIARYFGVEYPFSLAYSGRNLPPMWVSPNRPGPQKKHLCPLGETAEGTSLPRSGWKKGEPLEWGKRRDGPRYPSCFQGLPLLWKTCRSLQIRRGTAMTSPEGCATSCRIPLPEDRTCEGFVAIVLLEATREPQASHQHEERFLQLLVDPEKESVSCRSGSCWLTWGPVAKFWAVWIADLERDM